MLIVKSASSCVIYCDHVCAQRKLNYKGRLSGVVPMLGQRLRCWPSIKTTLGQRPKSAGSHNCIIDNMKLGTALKMCDFNQCSNSSNTMPRELYICQISMTLDYIHIISYSSGSYQYVIRNDMKIKEGRQTAKKSNIPLCYYCVPVHVE